MWGGGVERALDLVLRLSLVGVKLHSRLDQGQGFKATEREWETLPRLHPSDPELLVHSYGEMGDIYIFLNIRELRFPSTPFPSPPTSSLAPSDSLSVLSFSLPVDICGQAFVL